MILSIVVLSVTPLGQLGSDCWGVAEGLARFPYARGAGARCGRLIPTGVRLSVAGLRGKRTRPARWAAQNRYEIDPRQELLGLGAANLAAAFFQAYPVAGGLSQSSVNDKAGAKTPLALVFASVTIGLCLMFLTGLLRNLPNVVLAAIVLVAVKGLINIRELRHVWRVSRFEFTVSMVAFAGVLLLGILKGVIVAVLVSLLLRTIRRAANPHVAFLGQIAHDLLRHGAQSR